MSLHLFLMLSKAKIYGQQSLSIFEVSLANRKTPFFAFQIAFDLPSTESGGIFGVSLMSKVLQKCIRRMPFPPTHTAEGNLLCRLVSPT